MHAPSSCGYGVTGQAIGCPLASIVTYSVAMNCRKTCCSSAGSVPGILGRIVNLVAGEQDARRLTAHDDERLDRDDVVRGGVRDERIGRRKGGELLEVLDGREDQEDLAVRVGVQRAARREPPELHDLLAVD